jgi:hypothetical protein
VARAATNEIGMSTVDQRGFEAQMVGAFRAELFDYCARAAAGPRAGRPRRVLVTVVAAPGLEETRAQIRTVARLTTEQELPEAHVEVVFALDTTLPPHGYRFEMAPPLPSPTTVPGGPRAVPRRPPEQLGAAAGEVALVVGYGDRLQWTYPLFSTDAWIPLGRLVTHRPGPVLPMPAYLTAVPRGPLLMVRYWRDTVALRRTRERPEYAVVVDGQRLWPWRAVAVLPAGSIHYLRDGPRTELAYRVSRRN